MDSIIKREIEYIRSILLERGFREPLVEKGTDVEVIKDIEISQLFQKRPTWVVRVNPEDVANGYYAGLFDLEERPCDFLQTLSSLKRVQHQSWCAVLLQPSDNLLWIKITLLTSWLKNKEFEGYIFLKYPVVTNDGYMHGWDQKLLFIEFKNKGVYSAYKGKDIDYYPWRLSKSPWKCPYINTCPSKRIENNL